MRFGRIAHDEDALSPDIDVILLVAITVILAAVIATFVIGLGDNVGETDPQTSFTFEYDESANPNPTPGTSPSPTRAGGR